MAQETMVAHGDTQQIASFFVGGEEYGVNILDIREIIRPQPVTKIPAAAPFIEGAINLRGTVIPVVNMRRRFGLPDREIDKDARFMVVNVGTLSLGLVVDGIGRVRQVPANAVEPTPAIIVPQASEYIRGIVNLEDSMLLVLDLHGLFPAEFLDGLAGYGDA